jgi:hypothetical protein
VYLIFEREDYAALVERLGKGRHHWPSRLSKLQDVLDAMPEEVRNAALIALAVQVVSQYVSEEEPVPKGKRAKAPTD